MDRYKLIEEKFIREVNGHAYLYEHEKTKAKVFVVKNDDKNKSFSIGFRTPPKDDTGVAHILEHSVLCGSKKYPVKDPFVELVKGSLNTFLNAMTFPDKTMYPLASTNDVEFRNLMDVYLDAVFYPNIYKDERIFKQEGWHISVDEEDNLSYNGVVYNEMKGACSNPEQILYQKITRSLFGEHTYGYESGGEPVSIPDLTYDDFIDFHSTYYHPSNSYIFLYGDMDHEDSLKYMDEEYLSKFDYKAVDSEIAPANLDEKEVEQKYFYNLSETEDEKTKSYLSYSFLVEKSGGLKALSMSILDYILLSAQGAPLKEALVKTGLFEDVYGHFDNSYKEPFLSIVGKHTEEKNKEVFVKTINECLENLVKDGIPKSKIISALNLFEFRFRESDFGTYPKGVIYSINVMENWLYDLSPFKTLEYDEYFVMLREKMDEGYFEQLIKDELLGSAKKSLIVLAGDKKLQASIDEEVAAKLAKYKEDLGELGLNKLKDDFEKLNEFRTLPDKKKDYEKIPLLEIADIERKPEKIEYKNTETEGIKTITHECFTNNIVYGKLLFDVTNYDFKTLRRVALMTSLLRKVDTQAHTYSELSDEINLHTGGVKFNLFVVNKNFVADDSATYASASFKAFSENTDKAVDIMGEILTASKFDDIDRIKEVVAEQKARLSNDLVNSGHSTAVVRSMSYHTENGMVNDNISGIRYFKYIEKLGDEDFLRAEIEEVKKIYAEIFNSKRELIFVNSEEKYVDMAVKSLAKLSAKFVAKEVEDKRSEVEDTKKREGFITSSKVNYNAKSGNFIRSGFAYEGGLKVLKTLLSLDYLWKNIRVSGGAYGAFAQFKLDGNSYLATYRDPKCDKSYDIFDGLVSYIRDLELDEREMRKYIIGTIASLNTPLPPSIKGEKALSMYLTDTTYDDFVKEREQVLETDLAKLKSFTGLLEKTFENDYLCTIGSAKAINKSEKLEEKVNLLGK